MWLCLAFQFLGATRLRHQVQAEEIRCGTGAAETVSDSNDDWASAWMCACCLLLCTFANTVELAAMRNNLGQLGLTRSGGAR
jgi:hypothetical protein